jgi:hypothetical protein
MFPSALGRPEASDEEEESGRHKRAREKTLEEAKQYITTMMLPPFEYLLRGGKPFPGKLHQCIVFPFEW